MPHRCFTPLAIALTIAVGPQLFASRGFAAETAAFDQLRINQLQYIGSHNSYHQRPLAAKSVREWDYQHAPLDVQLDRGVRSFELDMHYKQGEFDVFHVPLVDDRSSCPKLVDGLKTVRAWSDAHPDHVPISFLFEFKSEGPQLDRRIKPLDAPGLEKLDQLLDSVFPKSKRISPDDVRGDFPTLRQAVEQRGWPTLAEARGKVMFVLHDEGRERAMYADNRPSLEGRVMFVRSNDRRDDGAVMILDDADDPRIAPMVAKNYFVRTRADAGLKHSDRRRDQALTSGAHIVSTDFPPGEADSKDGYSVTFPEAAARVNPVSGPAELRGQLLPR